MSLGAVLVIIVAAGDAHTVPPETLVALVTAAQRALPKETSVRLLAVSRPEREDLAGVEKRLGAKAVATLAWRRQPGGLRASLRMHVAGDRGWTERTIVFSARDAPAERGRTLGFAIAAMWPMATVAPEPEPPAAKAPDATPTTPHKEEAAEAAAPTTPVIPVAPAPAPSSPARPDHDVRDETSDAASAAPSASDGEKPLGPARTEVGLGVVGVTGLGGTAGAGGGTFEVSRRGSGTWGVRALLEVRGGTLPEVDAIDWVAAVGAGVEWWPELLGWGGRGGVGVYGDVLWTAHWIRRGSFTAPGNPTVVIPAESHHRMLPALEGGLVAAQPLGRWLQLLVRLGAEVAAGRTDVRTGDQPVVVATIPSARGVAGLTLRYAF